MAIYTLDDFIRLIEQEFHYLFRDHGHDLVFHKSVRSDEHMLVVIGSSDCRIRFQYDLGDIEVSIGACDAIIGWNKGIGNEPDWFPIDTVFEFLSDRQALTKTKMIEQDDIFGADEKYLAHVSKKLHRTYDEVKELFQKDTFWWQRLELQRFMRL